MPGTRIREGAVGFDCNCCMRNSRVDTTGGFDARVTVDRGFEYRQDLSGWAIPVVIPVAIRRRLLELEPPVPGNVTCGRESSNPESTRYRIEPVEPGGCPGGRSATAFKAARIVFEINIAGCGAGRPWLAPKLGAW